MAKGERIEGLLYFDGGKGYLELHAMRAPVGGYFEGLTDSTMNTIVQNTIELFERKHQIEILQLGRSGRHICIEDTPRNRRRYNSLQRKAIEAAQVMWKGMRKE